MLEATRWEPVNLVSAALTPGRVAPPPALREGDLHFGRADPNFALLLHNSETGVLAWVIWSEDLQNGDCPLNSAVAPQH